MIKRRVKNMKKIKIYAKENNKIETFLVSIKEDNLVKILDELDDYYENELLDYMIYFKGKNSIKKTLKDFLKNEKDIFNKEIKIDEVKHGKESECKIKVKRESKLTKSLKTIINDNDGLKLSYAIFDICNFKSNNEVEKKYINKILSCFTFSKKNNKFDIKKILLQIQYEMEDETALKYCDDETLFKTQKLPYSYNFSNKMNK